MKKVLFINACARPCSRSCELARHVLNRLPGQVEELRLYEASRVFQRGFFRGVSQITWGSGRTR